jgi:hypothetical protein
MSSHGRLVWGANIMPTINPSAGQTTKVPPLSEADLTANRDVKNKNPQANTGLPELLRYLLALLIIRPLSDTWIIYGSPRKLCANSDSIF